MIQKINRPIPFQGTETEKAANKRTHAFYGEHCGYCDCKPWHVAAEYPCGTEPPRETVKIEVPEGLTGIAEHIYSIHAPAITS